MKHPRGYLVKSEDDVRSERQGRVRDLGQKCQQDTASRPECAPAVVWGRVSFLYPGHGPEDIRRYLGHMTWDTAAVISWVICPGYLLISLGHVANHQGR